MPLRTAKPTVRIDSLPDRHRIAFFAVWNGKHVKPYRIEVAKDDPVAFKEQVDELILKTRERWGIQGK